MTAAFAPQPYDGYIVRHLSAPAPSPARLLCARTGDDHPAVLISGRGDRNLTRWSYGALETIDQVDDLPKARRALGTFAPVPRGKDLPPFVGGAVGFVSYEAGWRFAARPKAPPTVPGGLPEARFALYDAVYARDEVTGLGWLIAQDTRPAERRLLRLQSALTGPAAMPVGTARAPDAPEVTRERHEERVRRILELIRAGEVYQVNLTYHRSVPYSGAPEASFFRLLANPPPFAAFLDVADAGSVLSASPECFFTFDGPRQRAAVYPIKGTRPRGRTPDDDRRLARELLSDEKERAEHMMIVDLLRNDLGRIAAAGSVTVDRLAYLEKFAAVQHLTSRIGADLPRRHRLLDLFCALFPGGSITGAPKLRAMEIIEALEGRPRGIYTGAIGFVAPDETACFSIAIRTAEFIADRVRFGVGGGIVADSDPRREWEETVIKSRALSRALRAG